MAAQPVTLALDQGTHASRALLFDNQGKTVFSSKQEISLTRIDKHRVEQDACEILDSVHTVLRNALVEASKKNFTVTTAGLATQRSTVVAWDKVSGKPLAPAFSWQDTRAHDAVNNLGEHETHIRNLTGLKLSPHYGASKMRWLLDHNSAVSDAAAQGHLVMGPLASFLIFGLLEDNPLVVDHGNAARTQLWNITSRDWDDELLTLFDLDANWLPRCVPIRHDYGTLADSAIPLTCVNGDQAAAVFGLGGTDPGTAVINIGTGAFVLINTGDARLSQTQLLSGLIDSDEDNACYCLEGTVNGAGAALDWAEQQWSVASHLDIDWSSVTSPPIFINTIGGLGSPWWQPGGQPRIISETDINCRQDPRPCMAAVIESIVFMLNANLQEAPAAGIEARHIRIGGGLSRYDALCERLASLSGLRVIRTRQAEATGRGIAWLAAAKPHGWSVAADDVFDAHDDQQLKQRYQTYLTVLHDTITS